LVNAGDLLVVEKKCGGERETARVTFGHLSPFPYIVLRYANVTYKALAPPEAKAI
jgi:hypothetical protein